MPCRCPIVVPSALALVVSAVLGVPEISQDGQQDPQPRVVTPGVGTAPPSDAIVLFNGEDLTGWTKPDGQAPTWTVEDGHLVVQRGGGVISTRAFGDAQIHVEFATPAEISGNAQGRGNSGVYVQGRYEVQVLDSYRNETYPNGQCGAIYGHHAPLVNACRKPGAWQTYDIVFRAARFDADGVKTANARMTVFHNGVLIHDHAEVPARTTASPRDEGPEDAGLFLQDHGNPLHYRNIWIRPL